MIQTKANILTIIRKNQDKIRSFGVKKLGLFGSFVRDEQKSESDLDLLVEFEKGKKTFDNFINLSFFLENLINRQIELVTAESLGPYLKPHILQEIEYVTSSRILAAGCWSLAES